MASQYDVVIIGAGHNGLVAATLLARAGAKTLVLEGRDEIGGAALTSEIHPGFRCPRLAHAGGPLRPGLAAELGLASHGLKEIVPEVRMTALSTAGPALVLYQDPVRTARELLKVSARDGDRYPSFCASMEKLGNLLRPLLAVPPPDLDAPRAGDLWEGLKFGRGFRGLGRKDAFRLLRYGPMAVADLVAEWFETELLRAAVAARGVWGTFTGPWSAGTSVGLLLQAAGDGQATLPSATFHGGPGALIAALAAAARSAGATIRTGARVARVTVAEGRACGVTLESGESITARAVVSSADPKRTLLGLVDPIDLDPEIAHRVSNYRTMGNMTKINFALSALPSFQGASREALTGRVQIAPSIDDMERAFDSAKYGEIPPQPWLDMTIPSLADPSLAPSGAHVLSVVAQWTPYRLRAGDWASRAGEITAAVEKTITTCAPDFSRLIVARDVITPARLESEFFLTGGHPLHGEPSIDQMFLMRPIPGFAQHRMPVPGLYLCGAGSHPGGFLTGAPGANAAKVVAADLKRAPR